MWCGWLGVAGDDAAGIEGVKAVIEILQLGMTQT